MCTCVDIQRYLGADVNESMHVHTVMQQKSSEGCEALFSAWQEQAWSSCITLQPGMYGLCSTQIMSIMLTLLYRS